MSTPDSLANHTEWDMDALAAPPQAIPPFVSYVVPVKALGLIACRGTSDAVANVLAAAVAVGLTEVTISRGERGGRQVGPRFVVRFPFTQARLAELLGGRTVWDFDVSADDDRLCKVIDGTPEEYGVVLPWREPAGKPWWRFW